MSQEACGKKDRKLINVDLFNVNLYLAHVEGFIYETFHSYNWEIIIHIKRVRKLLLCMNWDDIFAHLATISSLIAVICI